MVYLFDIPAFFILFRETLEVTIILAVLLGFIDKLVPDDATLRKKLKRQIWIGTGAGLAISLIIGAIFIAIFYTVARNLWEDSEAAWEGAFCLIASVVITIMALSMVRISKWRAKWEGKLESATESYLQKHKKGNRWALIILPFTVVMRESLESIVFIGGIGFDKPASGLPIPIITGILAGFLVGWFIYAGSHKVSLQVFFVTTTVFLLFIAAGLFSYAIHELEEATADEEGEEEVVLWELKCCNPKKNYFWDIMKTIFGWRNKATLGPTVGYFVYWVVVICISAFLLIFNRKRDNEKSRAMDENEIIKSENKA